MLDPQSPARQHLVPVPHELHIAAVVPRYVVHAVRKLLARGKQLLEIAEATGHRLAARVDDPGVGQDQVNEPDVAEVVRHLVDEARRERTTLARTIDAGVGDILLAKAAQCIRLEGVEHGRVAWIHGIEVAALQIRDEPQDVRQLGGPFYLRVRCQDLLEER